MEVWTSGFQGRVLKDRVTIFPPNDERIYKRRCYLGFLFKFTEQVGRKITDERVL